MNFQAILFDFDGTLVDTEPVHMEAWLTVLERFGIFFDETESRAHYMGLNDRDFLETISQRHGLQLQEREKQELIHHKGARSLSLLAHRIPIIPGNEEFLMRAKEKAKLAIVSGSTHAEIDFVLKNLKWKNVFDPVVTSEDVAKGKPDPEGYLLACNHLKLSPHECLVIEDSPKGIQAAKLAGMRCIALSTTYPASALQEADAIVPTLSQIELMPIFRDE